MSSVTLHCGDCLDVMRGMEANSIHAIICDPPYMLNFMGKAFDRAKDNPAASVEVWAECLRVAKPGAHLLAFGGDRTHHRMMTAIEDAGWEIRTCLYWIFGSGFPKSHDISKAIDKHGGQAVGWFGPWLRQWREENGITQKQIAALFPSATGGLTGCVANWELGFNMPTPEQFNVICQTFGLPFASLEEAEREVIGQGKSGKTAIWNEAGTMGEFDITAPATDAARQWAGWGTALKPAAEIIVMAMKPLDGTFANNALVHGVGGLNVDACRIGTERPPTNTDPFKFKRWKEQDGNGRAPSNVADTNTAQGRWPANLLLDEEAARLLDEQSGVSQSKAGWRNNNNQGHEGWSNGTIRSGPLYSGHSDTGGASRFFLRVAHDEDDVPLRFAYVPKASKRDRDEGLEGMESVIQQYVKNRRCRTCGRQQVSGSPCNCANPDWQVIETERTARNHHPTVKPTALMRYLCRLVTPPNGTVLDPFMGSGSTGKAAKLEGFHFVGIELDEDYFRIAEKRIAAAQPDVKAQLPLLELAGAEEAHQ